MKLKIIALLVLVANICFAQDKGVRGKKRNYEKKQRLNEIMKNAEEGEMIFARENIFGIQLRTSGYGMFYELGIRKSSRVSSIFRIDVLEYIHEKQVKSGSFPLGTAYVYGKRNNFFPINLGYGQEFLLGKKGNKNGVSVHALYNGGLSIGLLKPYYLRFNLVTGSEDIKYSPKDSAQFLDRGAIYGNGGFLKGWKYLKVKPGVFLRTALRFDYSRYNETVSGIEAGFSAEYYTSKIPVMLLQPKDRQFFFQGYVALLFGNRK